jgi:hypothetical protein
MFCAKEFQPQLRIQWNAAPNPNAAAITATENQNWSVRAAGEIHSARGTETNGSCFDIARGNSIRFSGEKNASIAIPRKMGGNRFSTRAKMLATTPATNASLLSDPYSRNSRFMGFSACSRCSSNGSSSSSVKLIIMSQTSAG